MKNFINKTALVISTSLIAMATNAADLTNGIDVLSPAYGRSVETIAQADQLLSRAEDSLRKAFALQAYPGMNEEQILTLIELIRTDLSVVLTPERRRMEYQVIVPDGAFIITDEPN